MICPKGGFPTIRHIEVRDITAELLTETCSDVAIEPILRPLDGEHFQKKTAIIEEEARLDISARGFWRRGERAFFECSTQTLVRTYSLHPYRRLTITMNVKRRELMERE